jgi:peptidoglycan-associated lipoprotein
MENCMPSLKTPLVLSVLLALTACGTAPKQNDIQTPSNQAAATPTAVPATAAVIPAAIDPLDDPKSALAKRSVYFDYDKYELKKEYQPVISTHAQYLSAHKNRKIVIQGNTDERGSSEYNLALGQKRAEIVRKSLISQGVPDAQMEAVSFGKEKPKAQGSNEEAWTENRRADIVYNAK